MPHRHGRHYSTGNSDEMIDYIQRHRMTMEEFASQYHNDYGKALSQRQIDAILGSGIPRGRAERKREEAFNRPVPEEPRRTRSRFFKDRRGQWHKAYLSGKRKGRFAHFTRHDRKRLGITPKVKKRRPARVKKGPSHR